MQYSPNSSTCHIPFTFVRHQNNTDGTFYALLHCDRDIPIEQEVLCDPWHLRDKQRNMIAGVVRSYRPVQDQQRYEVLVLGSQEMINGAGHLLADFHPACRDGRVIGYMTSLDAIGVM